MNEKKARRIRQSIEYKPKYAGREYSSIAHPRVVLSGSDKPRKVLVKTFYNTGMRRAYRILKDVAHETN